MRQGATTRANSLLHFAGSSLYLETANEMARLMCYEYPRGVYLSDAYVNGRLESRCGAALAPC